MWIYIWNGVRWVATRLGFKAAGKHAGGKNPIPKNTEGFNPNPGAGAGGSVPPKAPPKPAASSAPPKPASPPKPKGRGKSGGGKEKKGPPLVPVTWKQIAGAGFYTIGHGARFSAGVVRKGLTSRTGQGIILGWTAADYFDIDYDQVAETAIAAKEAGVRFAEHIASYKHSGEVSDAQLGAPVEQTPSSEAPAFYQHQTY